MERKSWKTEELNEEVYLFKKKKLYFLVKLIFPGRNLY